MSQAITYGFLSILPLITGAIFGTCFKVKGKFIGIIAALGSGAMIGALTFGLMEESFKLGGLGNAIVGFIAGGLIFILGDLIIMKIGGRGHKRIYPTKNSTGWGIILAAILDGIPESIALGASLIVNKNLGFLVLIGIILNNLPEAMSSAYDLKKASKTAKEIMTIWIFVALLIFIFVILGNTVFANMSSHANATIQAFAAGSILAMLASTMMPEAFQESGLDASLATIVGFLGIFILSKAGI
ncbi:MAG: zinc/iron permease, zinc transporter, family [Candidatus Berkelbacteria bacterium]|nr:zinc/iron permease, zinc transporter, family [Candidatus Berkelbacteria bacterium]